MLVYFGMEDAIPVSTLLAIKYDLLTVQSPVIDDKKAKYLNYAGDLHYLSIVGSLLFATQSQLDIQHAISLVFYFGNNLGILHLEAAKQVLCYLKGIMEHGLILGYYSTKGFDLVGWTNSNWAQNLDDYHLVGGFIFEISGSTVT